MELAQRMARLGDETAFQVLVRARALEAQGRNVVHLEIGQPDFPTPGHIAEAAYRAILDGHTGYGPSAGLPECREAIAEEAGAARGVEVSPDEVVVTPGAKPILFFGMLATLNEGDEALYPDPGFPIYRSCIEFFGAKAVPVPLREANQFRLDPEEVESLVTPRTRLMIINSAHNPTGSLLTREDCARLAETCIRHDVLLMTDEPYRHIVYGREFVSPLSIPEMRSRTLVVDGFSKAYAMTGWRLGFGIGPRWLMPSIAQLQTNCTSCACTFAQIAGIAALRGPQDARHAMVQEFQRRRDFIVGALNAVPGVSCVEPHGAFYAWANVGRLGLRSDELAARLLNEVGVAGLTGTSFGAQGEGYIRFSYANSLENLQEGMRRFAEWCAALAG